MRSDVITLRKTTPPLLFFSWKKKSLLITVYIYAYTCFIIQAPKRQLRGPEGDGIWRSHIFQQPIYIHAYILYIYDVCVCVCVCVARPLHVPEKANEEKKLMGWVGGWVICKALRRSL